MSTTTATPTGGPSQRTPPDPAAIKSRIITHMNADHALSLRLYLTQYSHVPLPATKTAQMQDITLDHIIITLGPSSPASGRYRIPLDPPMKSLLEARERLVAMHNDCLAALDLSDVIVDRGRVALLTPDACPMTLDEIGIGRAWLAEGTVHYLHMDSTVDLVL
ncbi:hypothetical protein KCU88_g3624, partial [Aureobasidium melanogenum]